MLRSDGQLFHSDYSSSSPHITNTSSSSCCSSIHPAQQHTDAKRYIFNANSLILFSSGWKESRSPPCTWCFSDDDDDDNDDDDKYMDASTTTTKASYWRSCAQPTGSGQAAFRIYQTGSTGQAERQPTKQVGRPRQTGR